MVIKEEIRIPGYSAVTGVHENCSSKTEEWHMYSYFKMA
jgi:hypothetical protein